MYFKTLARLTTKGYKFGLLVILILRKPFISIKWWRQIDEFYNTPLQPKPDCWIEFSLQKDDGKKI